MMMLLMMSLMMLRNADSVCGSAGDDGDDGDEDYDVCDDDVLTSLSLTVLAMKFQAFYHYPYALH